MKAGCPLPGFGRVLVCAFAAAALFASPVAAGDPVVLFDEGHGQRFTVAGKGDLDLSSLAGIIFEKGGRFRTHTERIGPATLQNVKALVISGPFEMYGATEVAAIKEFLDNGGRLAVMLHIGYPVTTVLEAVGVFSSRGVIHEREDTIGGRSQDFRVSRFKEHPVTAGIEEFAVYGSWALKHVETRSRIIATTGPRAWMDVNRSQGYDKGEPVASYSIVVGGDYGKGSFLVFADDAIFQNRFLEGGNRLLAENLAAWLVN